MRPVTTSYLVLCLLITVPAVFSEAWFEMFSAEPPWEHIWQPFMSAFLHGANGNPLFTLIHLVLNMTLLIILGAKLEILLGSRRFFGLNLMAYIIFLLVQLLSERWINGSSGVIWAYSPFLLLFYKGRSSLMTPDMARVLMVIMWIVVTLAMGVLPRLFNPVHSWRYAFMFGNLFHFSAVATGFVFYFRWKDQLKNPNLKF